MKMRDFCEFSIILMLGCVPVLGQSQLVFPVVVNGFTQEPTHFQTTFRILNLSETKADVIFEAFGNDGKPARLLELFPVEQASTKTVFEIQPGGSVESSTVGDVPAFNGWARLTFDDGLMIHATAEVSLIHAQPGPHPICRHPSTEIRASAQVPAIEPARKFSSFSVLRANRETGFALLNPSGTATAEVFLSVLDMDGRLVASGALEIAPLERLSRFLPELVSGAPEDFMGSLRVTSLQSIAVGALDVLLPESKLVGAPLASPSPEPCIQVIQPARNPLTDECRAFPTPCDVPAGWETVSSCPE